MAIRFQAGATTVRLAVLCGGLWFGAGPGQAAARIVELPPLKVGETTVVTTELERAVAAYARGETSCPCVRLLTPLGAAAPAGGRAIVAEIQAERPGEYAYELTLKSDAAATGADEMIVYRVRVDSPVDGVSGELLERWAKPRRGELYATLDELEAQQAKGTPPLLIDVRQADSFAGAHAPGARNVPSAALGTRTEWRETPLILIDSGWGDEQLEERCARMQERGFASVRILHGGLAAWRMAGLPLEGWAAETPPVPLLAGSEVFSALAHADWLAIDAGAANGPAAAAVFDGARVPPGVARGDWIRRRIQAESRPVRVLIFDEDGADYATLREEIGPARWPVFFVEGGWQGYVAQLRLWTALRDGDKKRTTTAQLGAPGQKRCGRCRGL